VVTAGAGRILALDQGSHASRAVLFDDTGRELKQAHVPVATRCEAADRVEQDGEELLRSLRTAMLDACEASGDAPLLAAGLATQRSTVVAWRRSDGRPLADALSWQDRRNAAWLAPLAGRAERLREITGLPPSPHYGASKLRWYLDNVPAVQRAAAAGDLVLGPLSSFLVSRLTEERSSVVDPANASRTLLYDVSAQQWSPELLQWFGIAAAHLPRCVPTRHAFGNLASGAGRIPLTACTGDQSAAAFAFGPPSPSVALVNVGTGAFIQRVAPAGAAAAPGILRSVLSVDEDGVLMSHEGTVNGAGSALEVLREQVAVDVDRALAALATRPPLGDVLPIFINGVSGLGAPYWLSDFPSEFIGEGDDSARVAAVLESIVFLLCVNLDALQSTAPLAGIRISGGLARNDYLCRCLAALSGLPVERRSLVEATARGVAYLAAGKPVHWRDVPSETVFVPENAPALHARHARWREAMEQRVAQERSSVA